MEKPVSLSDASAISVANQVTVLMHSTTVLQSQNAVKSVGLQC